MKKILILTTIPAPYRYEVFNLLNEKYDIDVFYERCYDSGRAPDWFATEGVIVLDNKTSVEKYNNTLKKLKDYDFVLVYEYSTTTAMKLMLKCIKNNIPYALNSDGAFINNNIVKNAVKSFFVKRAAICFAGSKSAEKYFLNLGAKKEKIASHNFTSLFEKDILTAPPTFDEKQKLKEELGLPSGIGTISVGRFMKSKGFDNLINAWKNVPDDYYLLIVGGGSEKANYEKQIEELGLKNVKIHDYLPMDILFKYYQASDIFILPTLTDVWGLVVNEAMANGLPVITTDMCIAGVELIDNDLNGYVTPTYDIDAMSEAVVKIGRDVELRKKMSENNIKKIHNYTYERIAEAHIQALKTWEIENAKNK